MSHVNHTTDPRQQRGEPIAATLDLRRRGDDWIVPSQSGKGTYRVRLGAPHPTCSCPDHQTRRVKCKHIRAVEISVKREERPDGTTVVTETKRTTYKQNWPAYNKAQTHETERFAELLHGLCRGIVQPKQGKGRPRLALADVAFASVFKVYSTVSGRRATSDLKAWQERGYLSRAPHYNSVFNYLDDPALTPILKALIEESASPLKAVETAFAMIKGKFGDAVRSKGETAQVNEVLCKVLAHNLCVLVQAIDELGIEPAFWAESTPAQKVGAAA